MQSRTAVAKNIPPATNPDSSPFPAEFLFLGMNTLNIGIAIIDRSLRFRAINHVLADMNNLPPEAHPGKPLYKILGPLLPKVQPALEQVFATGHPLPNVQLSGELPTLPQPIRWLQFFFPLLGNCGHVIEVGAFVIESKMSPAYETSYKSASSIENTACMKNCKVNLSGREQEVLQLLATGKSNKEVASILAISVKTVEYHRSRLMLKIHAPSLTHLVHYAIRYQFVPLQG